MPPAHPATVPTPRRWQAIVLLLTLMMLAGCVNVPTSGDLEPVQASGRAEQPRVEIRVHPPAAGAAPRVIVSGFLSAMADYQPNYEVARQYLTEDTREAWRPESGVQIISDNYTVEITDTHATLEAPRVGSIGPDGSYQAAAGTLTLDFGMVKDANGEWRISKPPQGLVITEYYFSQFYSPVNLYFFEPGMGSLVPDPIYVPRSNLTATNLVQRLSDGPTTWLRPVVTSAMPQRSGALAVPVDSQGVADVPLTDAAASLTEQQRTLMAAQTVWTLRQVPDVTGVRFLLNGTPYVIRGAVDQVVGITSMETFAAISPQISTQLYGAQAQGVVRLDDAASARQPAPLPGPLGTLQGVRSLAVNNAADRIAVVTGGGSTLRVGLIGEQEPVSIVTQAQNLQRPQFTRFNEVVALDLRSQGSVVWMANETTAQRVQVDLPAGFQLQTLRVAPDGIRAAVIVRDRQGASHLGLMQLTRDGGPHLGGFRGLALTLAQGTSLTVLTDVAWYDSTSLVVLAAEGADRPARPYRVSQDGTQLNEMGTPDNWQATALTSSQARGEGGTDPVPAKVIMVGAQGTVWRYQDNFAWVAMAEAVQAAAYPG